MRQYDEEADARHIDRNKWMTRTEATAALGIPSNWIKPMIDRGDLKGLQRGRWWYVERASVEAYKRRNR